MFLSIPHGYLSLINDQSLIQEIESNCWLDNEGASHYKTQHTDRAKEEIQNAVKPVLRLKLCKQTSKHI